MTVIYIIIGVFIGCVVYHTNNSAHNDEVLSGSIVMGMFRPITLLVYLINRLVLLLLPKIKDKL